MLAKITSLPSLSMTPGIEKTVDELLGIMADVSSCYAVWRELTDADNREMYKRTKNEYEYFFMAIDRANFAMVINGLHMLLEEKTNTHNLRTLLKKQRSLGRLYEARIDAWLAEIESWQPMITKITILRSNVYAHRGGKATAVDFVRMAAITPNEIGDLINKVETLLRAFARAVLLNSAVLPFADPTRNSTKALMSMLNTSIK